MTSGNLHHQAARLAPLLLLVLGVPVLAADAWHCAAPTATAYRYDPARDRWQTLVIPVQDQDFLIQRSGDPAQAWEVRWGGNDDVLLRCAGDFDAQGLLRCGPGGADSFEMNRNTLAFTSHLFRAGGLDTQALTAATVTGTCEAL